MTENDFRRIVDAIYKPLESLVRELVADEARRIPYEIRQALNPVIGEELRAHIRKQLEERLDVWIEVEVKPKPSDRSNA